jgi:hypothetical protein
VRVFLVYAWCSPLLCRLVDKKELAPLEELINGLVAAQK